MNLTDSQVAQIKACQGIYRPAHVAKHFGVHRSTVARIWAGERTSTVPTADDFIDIDTPLCGADLREAIRTYLQRGMRPVEVANALGCGKSTVYIYGNAA